MSLAPQAATSSATSVAPTDPTPVISESGRPPLLARVMRAGSLTLVGNIASQVLRFGSNLVLTRLLFPEAFGLMAIAQSILTAAALVSDVGLQQSVVRSARGHEPGFLNTIWTLQIAKGAVILAIMSLGAVFAARGYGQPMLLELMPALGVASLINGFASTNVALVNRQIEAGRLTLVELGSQVVGIAVMLGWAAVSPTPWALVGGNLATALSRSAATHLMLSGPGNALGWDRSVVQEVWKFGGWVMLSSTVTFLAGEGRNLLNAALVDARTVGLLVLSTTLAFVVWNAIQQISGRVLYPAYAEVWRERPHHLPSVVQRSRRWQLLGGCGVAALFALTGDRLVGVFYDARYREAGIFLQIQAVGTMFSFLNASYSGVLWAVGRPGLGTILLAIQVLIVTCLIFVGHALGGALGLVTAAAFTGILMYPINSLVYHRFGLFQPKTDWLPMVLGVALAAYVYAYGSWASFVH
ncbi:MAG: oligosaccharide flippase family protein [Betaproteobacteria bacterium]